MQLADFDFHLPEDRIALRPASPRDAARLLVVRSGAPFEDLRVADLPGQLRRGDVLVLNDTRVIPARLKGVRVREESRVAVEATLHRRLSGHVWTAFMRPGKRLAAGDRIVFGRDRQIAEAKKFALDLAGAGYHPPVHGANCYATGIGGKATLMLGVYQFKVGGFISDYDAQIAGMLATVLCGGDLSQPQWVDEEYLLDLERTTFMRLLANEKTQARMMHMLQTGKPLRN